jgi:hypothetical protein
MSSEQPVLGADLAGAKLSIVLRECTFPLSEAMSHHNLNNTEEHELVDMTSKYRCLADN